MFLKGALQYHFAYHVRAVLNVSTSAFSCLSKSQSYFDQALAVKLMTEYLDVFPKVFCFVHIQHCKLFFTEVRLSSGNPSKKAKLVHVCR